MHHRPINSKWLKIAAMQALAKFALHFIHWPMILQPWIRPIYRLVWYCNPWLTQAPLKKQFQSLIKEKQVYLGAPGVRHMWIPTSYSLTTGTQRFATYVKWATKSQTSTTVLQTRWIRGLTGTKEWSSVRVYKSLSPQLNIEIKRPRITS